MKNKIADSIFNKLSDILKSSEDDLKEFSSIDKLDEYTPISEKRAVIRRITVLVDGDANSIKNSISSDSSKAVNSEMLKDVNELFTDIITGKKPKAKPTKKTTQTLKRPKSSKKQPLRGQDGRFISLTSLLKIINDRIGKSVKDNMGKGSAKSILNYRTGRFSESVVVKRLTRTRDDAITAFYTYMKYPYQTFEPGFKQGGIPSRDPRKLIGKSIRQIATEYTKIRFKVERE